MRSLNLLLVHILAFQFQFQHATAFVKDQPPISSRNQQVPLGRSASDGDGGSNDRDPSVSRRQAAELTFAAVGLGTTYLGTRENTPQDYGLWGILPVGTYKQKKTIRETIVPGQIWTFDQKFGILNVQVPLRMTIVKLSDGGLFVYDPIAATPECLELVNEIVRDYGPIRHIVLGSVALEHKVYSGVFAQKYPGASVWLQEGQYSFPNNLPTTFLGFPADRTKSIPNGPEEAPLEWNRDFDFATLGPFVSRDGAFGETVFHHRPTKTLLVTDTCVEVNDEVPLIYDSDPAPLLYHARDTVTDNIQDTPAVRRKGWRRVVLFALYFNPADIVVKDVGAALKERRPDINSDFAGIYPWDWVGDDSNSFNALAGGPLVAPILQALLLNRFPVESLDFADKVSKWKFKRIIPAHLKNNLKFNGKDYRKSFGFLETKGVPKGYPSPLKGDFKLLRDAEVGLVESGAIAEAPPLVGGKFSRAEIIEKTTYRCRQGVCAPKAPI